jgi:flagellar basal-body rod modification protein FlgD
MSTVGSASGNAFLDKLQGTTSASAAANSVAASATTAKEASERFLKLLVTQLQNQDPMNPVDNAQMTSQMAQISTVSGIEKLNLTVEKLNGQFVQMQAVQGAGLVGKDVLVPGDKLSVVDGTPQATFELGTAASRVKVEVLSPAGRLVDTINLATMPAGRHDVAWTAGQDLPDADAYRFRVTATTGSTTLDTTSLMRDRVDAVNTGGTSLTVELERSGRVAYNQITALD